MILEETLTRISKDVSLNRTLEAYAFSLPKKNRKRGERRTEKMNKKKYCVVATASILLFALGLSYLCIQAHAEDPCDITIEPGTIPPYTNTNIQVQNSPPVLGQPNGFRAYVKNLGPDACVGVTVIFYIAPMGINSPATDWILVGITTAFGVPSNTAVWSPWVGWVPTKSGHWCVIAVANCVLDSNPGNNRAQLNLAYINAAAGGSLTVPFKLWPPILNMSGTNLRINVTGLPTGTEMHFLPRPPPYDIEANQSLDLELNIELPENATNTLYDIIVEGFDENGTAYGGFGIQMKLGAVGGIWLPIDKLGLMIPYVGLSSAMLGITVASAIYARRIKRRQK